MRRHKHSRHTDTESSSNSERSDSRHHDSTHRAKKVKYISVDVPRREAAKGSDSSDSGGSRPPRKAKQVVVGVSKAKAAKNRDSTSRIPTPPSKNTKYIRLGVSKTIAAKGSDITDCSSTLSPRMAEDGGLGVSETTAAKYSDSADCSPTQLPRKASVVNVGVSGMRAATGSNCSDGNPTAPPGKSKEGNAEVCGREVAKMADSSSHDSASSPRGDIDVSAEVSGSRTAATTAKLASVNVSMPIVQITVHKPAPSLWSRLWSGLSRAKDSQEPCHDGALEDPKVPVSDSTGLFVTSHGSSLPEDKQTKEDSPALQQDCEPCSSSVDIDVPSWSSEAVTREPPAKRRKICTTIDSKKLYDFGCLSDERDTTAIYVDAKEGSHHEAELFTPQSETKSAAVARVAVNSYKQLTCRSYIVCKRIREATNDIGLSIFRAHPADQNLCLSVYGLSFMIALTKHYAIDTKTALKETLRCGAMEPKDNGLMPYSCKEVVTTLRRRITETDQVSVMTEAYLRPSAKVNQQAGHGADSSTKNTTSHLLTAEFESYTLRPAQEAWNEVLFNTACFENLSRCSFSNQSTYTGSFLNNWTEKVTVTTMRRTSTLAYSFDLDRQVDVVCLPYADGEICMTLIVQRSPSSDNLSDLTPADVWGFVHGARNMLLTLHLPKFRVSTTVYVEHLMNEIACAALQDRWMMFLHAKLQTTIVVDELNGPVTRTECISSAADPVTVVVDRPFHFVITDRTSDLILYVGRVTSLT